MINLTFDCQNTPKGEVHIFNVIRTTVKSFRHASSKVSEFQITQTRYPIYPNVAKKLLSSMYDKIDIFFSKRPKRGGAHLQCVQNNCAKFQKCQVKGVKRFQITQTGYP